MTQIGVKELLEAGVHFGHQTSRWDPSMRRFIAGEIDGIHIIDLLQTEETLEAARKFVAELSAGGGKVLFVGTKKQAAGPIEEWAEKSAMPYVSRRWLPGLLTNFNVASARIKRLHELTEMTETGQLDLLPTKERMNMQAELAKLEFALGGVREMKRVPNAVFIVDLKSEEIALKEATRLRLPVIALVDSNCDPSGITFPIPGNDDAIRSCELVVSTIGEAASEGASAWAVVEEQRRLEEEARRKKEEEERVRREEEERARREAIEAEQEAEKAARQAEEAAAPPAEVQSSQVPKVPAIPDHPQAVVPDHPQAVVPDHPQAIAPETEAPEPEAPGTGEPTPGEGEGSEETTETGDTGDSTKEGV
jgi:small subunit ribosomal protein S2